MHIEALNFILFVKNKFPDYFVNKTVLDVGSGDINGNNLSLFENCTYHGNDVIPANNVTIVSRTKDLPFPNGSIDTIISTECFHLDPEYPASFLKIYQMLKPNGLFTFTCASMGRAEHGTRRTSPQHSYGTIGNIEDMVDYYKNLTEKDINDVLNLNELFSTWDCYYNEKWCDLYFVGIKKGDSNIKLLEKFVYPFVKNTSDKIYSTQIREKTNNMPDIYLLINTCKHYYSNIRDLLRQINLSWFPNKNVIIVSGQEDSFSTSFIDDVKIVRVKYTGLHLTSVIYLNEHIDLYNDVRYWVTLPDTIKFGNSFFDKLLFFYITHFESSHIQAAPFVHPYVRPTMDMGIVHRDHIMRMTNYLKKIKTNETNLDVLKILKKQLIYDENTIFGIQSGFAEQRTKHDCVLLKHSEMAFITYNPDFLTETLQCDGKIQEVYFHLLDLYKYQRNFKNAEIELILTL